MPAEDAEAGEQEGERFVQAAPQPLFLALPHNLRIDAERGVVDEDVAVDFADVDVA